MGQHTRQSARLMAEAKLEAIRAKSERRCSHDGCSRVLFGANKSGLCFEHVHLKRRPPADAALPRRARATKAVTLFPNELVARVAASLWLTPQEVTGPSQTRNAMNARAACAVIMRQAGMSYPRIARRLGRTHHTTVMNMVRHFDRYVEREPMIGQLVRQHTQSEERA